MAPVADTTLVPGKVDWKGKPARKNKHGGALNSWFIIALFAADSFATLALAVNIVTYFSNVMYFQLTEASDVLTNYLGTSYVVAIVAAYISDAYLSRYKVILVSALLEILGFVLLTVQAKSSKFKPVPCDVYVDPASCVKVHGRNSSFLYASIYLIAVGTAGLKVCVAAHGADQFDGEDPREAKQRSSYFNWLFLGMGAGSTASLILVSWLQTDVGWGWGFGLSAIGSFVGTVIFVVGIPRYRVHAVPFSDPISPILKVFVSAVINSNHSLPSNSKELYEIDSHGDSDKQVEFLPHTDHFRFLDKAAIRGARTSCRVTHVESAKILLGMIPIFLTVLVMELCFVEFVSYSITQGLTMDPRIGKIKATATPFLPFLFTVLLVPVYDRLFVPLARRLTGLPAGVTPLQRVGAGVVFSILALAAGAVLEVRRKKVAEDRDMVDAFLVLQVLPISFFWLSVQYFFYALSQVFAFVGLLEFFYSEAPRALRASATYLLWFSVGLGYFLSNAVVGWVNDATKNNTATGGWLVGFNLNRNHLNYFYWMLAVLSFANFLCFVFFAMCYKYRSKTPARVTDDGAVDQNAV
ncbi:protein NRT1/ PTR FAMILY 4.5-like [Iris pallida]|uniref:Protein NRT1/ PTR FAMILY 4.5-like n=1 Tax=Iris pallida TaxID=29817 RepID=A0AAX6FF36_IRIPA|nr:protein NRT1/ PTR FAMILY 4.5-like [Iris pallida]